MAAMALGVRLMPIHFSRSYMLDDQFKSANNEIALMCGTAGRRGGRCAMLSNLLLSNFSL